MGNKKSTKKAKYFFEVRDCALVALASGISAQNLREFREGLLTVPQGSIYHHFWGRLLNPQFDDPEYNNDFAAWAYHGLHEKALAERLSAIDPIGFEDIESLRQELIDTVEMRLDESEMVPWASADQQFYFLRSQIVVFDTGLKIEDPAELSRAIPSMSASSIFYHFIDARRRSQDRCDDFSTWLAGMNNGCKDLRDHLATIDPYFSSLKELRKMLATLFNNYFCGESK